MTNYKIKNKYYKINKKRNKINILQKIICNIYKNKDR